MDHFAGLDVSVKETSICIVDEAGGIVREVKAASEPEARGFVRRAHTHARPGVSRHYDRSPTSRADPAAGPAP